MQLQFLKPYVYVRKIQLATVNMAEKLFPFIQLANYIFVSIIGGETFEGMDGDVRYNWGFRCMSMLENAK